MTYFKQRLFGAASALGALAALVAGCGTDLAPGSQLVGQRCYSDLDCAAGLVCDRSRVCIPEAPVAPRPDMEVDPDLDAGPPTDLEPDPDSPPDLSPDLEPDPDPDMTFFCQNVRSGTYCIDDLNVLICSQGEASIERCFEGSRCEGGACVPSVNECELGGEDDFCISEEARQVCRIGEGGERYFDVEFCQEEEFCLEGICLNFDSECFPGFDDFCLGERSRQYCVVDDEGRGVYETEQCGVQEICLVGTCVPEGSQCAPKIDDFCASERVAQRCVLIDGRYNYERVRCGADQYCLGNGECIEGPPPMECSLGEQYCVGEFGYDVCLGSPNGGTEFIYFDCPPETRCEDGACRFEDECQDFDLDGAFGNCEPFDCDDFDPNRSPYLMETCDDGIDNDCDGRVDEGCQPGPCCTGASACGLQQFCQDCVCQTYNASSCQFQNQPCTNLDSFDGIYYCADLTGSGGGRCLGLCDPGFPNPSSTCPSPGQTCAFGDNQGNPGVCFEPCSTSADCQAGDEAGCFLYDSANSMSPGVCVPKSSTMLPALGQTCNPLDFFGCQGSAVCADDGFGNGICQESCRPFFYGAGAAGTDCPAGSFCTAYAGEFGVCQPDNGAQEFALCSVQGTSCSEDAVSCYPTQFGRLRCRRTCRISQGAADCNVNQVCQNVGQGDVGLCRSGAP